MTDTEGPNQIGLTAHDIGGRQVGHMTEDGWLCDDCGALVPHALALHSHRNAEHPETVA